MAHSRWRWAERSEGNWMRQRARLAAWLLALDLAALCQGNADRQACLSQHISASLHRRPQSTFSLRFSLSLHFSLFSLSLSISLSCPPPPPRHRRLGPAPSPTLSGNSSPSPICLHVVCPQDPSSEPSPCPLSLVPGHR